LKAETEIQVTAQKGVEEPDIALLGGVGAFWLTARDIETQVRHDLLSAGIVGKHAAMNQVGDDLEQGTARDVAQRAPRRATSSTNRRGSSVVAA